MYGSTERSSDGSGCCTGGVNSREPNSQSAGGGIGGTGGVSSSESGAISRY